MATSRRHRRTLNPASSVSTDNTPAAVLGGGAGTDVPGTPQGPARWSSEKWSAIVLAGGVRNDTLFPPHRILRSIAAKEEGSEC